MKNNIENAVKSFECEKSKILKQIENDKHNKTLAIQLLQKLNISHKEIQPNILSIGLDNKNPLYIKCVSGSFFIYSNFMYDAIETSYITDLSVFLAKKMFSEKLL